MPALTTQKTENGKRPRRQHRQRRQHQHQHHHPKWSRRVEEDGVAFLAPRVRRALEAASPAAALPRRAVPRAVSLRVEARPTRNRWPSRAAFATGRSGIGRWRCWPAGPSSRWYLARRVPGGIPSCGGASSAETLPCRGTVPQEQTWCPGCGCVHLRGTSSGWRTKRPSSPGGHPRWLHPVFCAPSSPPPSLTGVLAELDTCCVAFERGLPTARYGHQGRNTTHCPEGRGQPGGLCSARE
eukprot:scaffold3886_cov399-Prasinococcus_capsulatus_cf.AAC.2